MADFRLGLYQSYLATSKSNYAQFNTASYWAWCQHKYLPLLSGLSPESRILEVGCGLGYMLDFLGSSGFLNVEGIDISAEQVHLAAGRGLRAQVADVFDYLAANHETYDAIMALDFIEHFSKDELLRLPPLFYQALKAGGRLILQTPNGQGLFAKQIIYSDLTHLTILTPRSLGQVLNLAGFEGITFHETGPAPKNLAGVLRVAGWAVIKQAANLVRRIETGKTQAVWTENMICRCYKP